MSAAEPWLRGPVDGVILNLQPVAHALLHASEELTRILPPLSAEQVWRKPGSAASIGYHVLHFNGTIDRMLTYAGGQGLSAEQFETLQIEKQDRPEMDGAALLRLSAAVLDRAAGALREIDDAMLDQPRAVGRMKLPATVRGLYYEIALHTARHVGQIATTAKLIA